MRSSGRYCAEGKSTDSGLILLGLNPWLSFTSCVISGNLLNLSGLCSPSIKTGTIKVLSSGIDVED